MTHLPRQPRAHAQPPLKPGTSPHLGPTHLVAPVAARHCAGHEAPRPANNIGGVACGRCWEQAIRDDERAVVLFGLRRELPPNPHLVDEIAVERALAGEPIQLTEPELLATARQLARRGLNTNQVADRLRVSEDLIRRLLTPRRAADAA